MNMGDRKWQSAQAKAVQAEQVKESEYLAFRQRMDLAENRLIGLRDKELGAEQKLRHGQRIEAMLAAAQRSPVTL